MSQEKTFEIINDDPYLGAHYDAIYQRYSAFKNTLERIEKAAGNLETFASAHEFLGLNYNKKEKGWFYREWAPSAQKLFLVGDFNDWNRESHPMHQIENGVWEIFLPDASYKKTFKHQSLFKVLVHSQIGIHERIPAYARRVLQNPDNYDFAAQVWNPSRQYKWKNDFTPDTSQPPLIYECHTGMAQEKEGVGTYKEFTENVLPRAKELGYNTIQLMAVQEHPYYGSYGYHVSSLFAPSSRFGTPEELKELIDTAHGMGIAVIMDIVHSHVVKNFNEGLNFFDGTEWQYFHEGGRGNHDGWDSKLFNYGKWEVMQFLLSNVAYWLREFKFDGFRFDGVTSMLYVHHGLGSAFDHYDKYFYGDVDNEAVTYLQLANHLTHRLNKYAISVAEDVSGMPGLCRSIEEGGIEFDFRLGMGIPDYWIKILKERADEDWDIHQMWDVMVNRRWKEKTVAYAESHDQALVGDKTLAFWLMDKEMYWHMQVKDNNLIIDRGIALHKMIRLFTASLGGDAYLTFFGNEFGHPEWIDFPSERNNWSYKHAQRKWSLADNPELKYKFLKLWDAAMIHLLQKKHILQAQLFKQLNMDTVNNTIIFEKNNLIFVFNFHPSNAIPDYKFYVPQPGTYRILLNSDAPEFGGHDRVDMSLDYSTNDQQQLSLYVTNRTCMVLERVSD